MLTLLVNSFLLIGLLRDQHRGNPSGNFKGSYIRNCHRNKRRPWNFRQRFRLRLGPGLKREHDNYSSTSKLMLVKGSINALCHFLRCSMCAKTLSARFQYVACMFKRLNAIHQSMSRFAGKNKDSAVLYCKGDGVLHFILRKKVCRTIL